MDKKKVMYTKDDDQKCIAAIVILPAPENKFDIYVGWEWERAIKDNCVKFYKSRKSFVGPVTYDDIDEVCNWGIKIESVSEIMKIFPPYLIAKITGKEEDNGL